MKKGIDRNLIDISKLVWPQPPDLPRIKFLSEHFGEPPKPVEAKPKKKKQGWMDRMAGVQQRESGDPTEPSHTLGQPYGIAADSKGRVYVGDTFVAAVFIFNLETKEVKFLRNGHEAAFRNIIGIAIDDSDRLFVSDAGMHQVSVFNPELKLESTFGTELLKRPSGIAIDNENRFVYVVDTGAETVFVFDADNFKLLRKLGGPAKKLNDDDPETFAKPTNVAVDKDGNVYISDTLNNRIQIFDADGKFISMFGKAGDAPGTLPAAKGHRDRQRRPHLGGRCLAEQRSDLRQRGTSSRLLRLRRRVARTVWITGRDRDRQEQPGCRERPGPGTHTGFPLHHRRRERRDKG